MKIGRGVSELWKVEYLPLPLTWPMAYTTARTTVQAVIDSTMFVCIELLCVPNVKQKKSTLQATGTAK